MKTQVSTCTPDDFAEEKRVKLFERISLFASLMGVVHFFLDFFNSTPQAASIDLIIAGVMLTCYIIHRKGFYVTARVSMLSILNLIFVIYACIMPKEVGIYLFFLPLMALSMTFFGRAQHVYRLFFVILSAVFLASLFYFDFDLIGTYQAESANEETFLIINLFSCAVVLVVCIYFILGVNEESERRLHTLAEEIKVKNINLEKTNAELDRFLYSTSHDLRSPLLSIKGLVNITRNEAMRPEVKKYLSMIEERADRLDFFIRDIIDYSRNSRTGLCFDLVDIQKLVCEVQQNFQFLEGASNIDFQNEIFPDEVVVDRSRAMIVLNNLISNAIKYHRLDGKNQWIKTCISKTENTLTIMIADNGQGIHADRKDKVFEMFYRGTERSQGSGLGLYIVKEAVDKMKGTIRVESTEGEGTSFFVTIPLQEVQPTTIPQNSRQQVVLIENSMA